MGMRFTNRKENYMANVTRHIVVRVVIIALGLIAGMLLKAGYMLVSFALTSEGNYYEAVGAGFAGLAFGAGAIPVLFLIKTIITNTSGK